ncbi:HAD hydrolase family protein [Desulfitobacterium sp.]|uniref:HAD hydrolase family protein n=1 Tax=Desulfitobacterium sp. TaxID=49981 RepID=UPI002C35F5DA|nr:HAD hydrolase family protein [Desulfitobacterium sp.]HVJ50263.1 HAD hydrolase family protein [Desulfitobacterium sp.]
MAKRSYFEEIQELESTWNTVQSHEVVINPPVKADLFSGSACCIGSGGSMAIAKLWQFVFEEYHLGMAKTVTPYEFNQFDRAPDTVFLFSASGKNHDILQVFRSAARKDCKIIVFTVNANSALVRLAKSLPDQSVVIYPKVSTPKDGFLAVNSIIAMAGIIVKVAQSLLGKGTVEDSPVATACKDHQENVDLIKALDHVPTIQIIASEWGIPAGHDLETRLAESGVSPCFLTDPRNFAHGRFIWLETYRDSFVVLFGTPRSKSYIQRFIKNLPEFITPYSICAPYGGLDGAVYCLTRSMLLFSELAKAKAIDPGKPAVPEWGRKLHSLRLGLKDIAGAGEELVKGTRARGANYPALEMTFVGIVSDIDGTLLETENRYSAIGGDIGNELNRLLQEGLVLAFATGRGKSALELLRNSISQEFWPQVIVGLYNGTRILRLDEDLDEKQALEWASLPSIASLVEDLCGKIPGTELTVRPTQITVAGIEKNQRDFLEQELSRNFGQGTKFMKFEHSGHSLDILPYWASKLNVLENMSLLPERQVLCIGDQGQLGGNDEEILSWKPSASVGKARPVSNACLWLGKDERSRGEQGMLRLLKAIEQVEGGFKLDIKSFSN